MSLATIVSFLVIYKYWILLPISIIEGPILAIVAGFLCSLGYMNFWYVFLIIVLGDFLGDTFYYYLGAFRGSKILNNWLNARKGSSSKFIQIENIFKTHPGRTLILGKLYPALGTFVLLFAGVAKIPYRKFLFYVLVATIPKSFALVLVGYHFGSAYVQINKYIDYTVYVSILIPLLIFAIYYLARKISNKYI